MVDDLGRHGTQEHRRERSATAAADHDQLGTELGRPLDDERGRAAVQDGPLDGQVRAFERGGGGIEHELELVAGLLVVRADGRGRDDQRREQLGGRLGDRDDLR